MRRVVVTILAVAFAVLPAGAQQYVFKFGTLAPEGSEWLVVWNKIAKEIEKATGGRLKIVTYGGGVMGDEEEMIRKIHIGQLHGGGFTVQAIGKIAPELWALSIPFIFESWDEIDYIREKFYHRFAKFFRDRGFELLALVDQGFIYFYSTRPDVRSFSDLSKTKVWVWKGEVVMDSFAKLLGAKIVYLSVPDVLAGLQTGMVESFQTSPLACLALQWCTRVKVVIDYPYRYEPGVVVASLKFINQLPEDLREIPMKVGRKYIPMFLEKTRKAQEESLEKLRAMGIKFFKPSEEEIKRLRTEVQKRLWANLTPEQRKLLLDVIKELQKYRAQKAQK